MVLVPAKVTRCQVGEPGCQKAVSAQWSCGVDMASTSLCVLPSCTIFSAFGFPVGTSATSRALGLEAVGGGEAVSSG